MDDNGLKIEIQYFQIGGSIKLYGLLVLMEVKKERIDMFKIN